MSADLHLVPDPEPPGSDPEPSAPSPIRVALVDDHVLVRRSLGLLLEGEGDIQVVSEADNLVSATHRVDERKTDVLVLDFRLPGGPSGEMIGKLRRRFPATQIVVLTMHNNPAFAGYAIAAGALGFVRKELADAELPAAVRAAARREVYVSPEVLVGSVGSRAF